MTLLTELASLNPWSEASNPAAFRAGGLAAAVPKVGEKAPSISRTEKSDERSAGEKEEKKEGENDVEPELVFPREDRRAAIVVFLRHCGCPFAEKTLHQLRTLAPSHPSIDFIAISHSSRAATARWLISLQYTTPSLPSLPNPLPHPSTMPHPSISPAPLNPLPSNLRLLTDPSRILYAAWGLGPSSFGHVFSPGALWGAVKLGRAEEGGYQVRPTESGSRWQTAGAFAVDGGEAGGVVRWVKVPRRADEDSGVEEGVSVLVGGMGGKGGGEGD